jgi:pimeloyl-ACP methyl ester carboxylesterase
VQAAAYAARLRPLAEHGYAVFIVKVPLNIAFLGTQHAGAVIAAHPEIKHWAVGGHSLGGVAASAFLKDRQDVSGLILYASYPAGDLSARTDLVVVSIYGTRDALATVGRVESAKPRLPPQTRYVAIQGGNHSYFGDYGMQTGDGIPSISRAEAARQIVAATVTAMDEVAGK